MLNDLRIWVLLFACLAGCGNGSGPEFRVVEAPPESPPQNVAESALSAEPADSPSEPPAHSSIPPATPKKPDSGDAVASAPVAGEGLAVSSLRPFAVPLPERLPVEASAQSPDSQVPLPGVGVKLLVPEKSFSTEGPEKALRVTFDDIDLLKVLNMDPVLPDVESHLPDWLSGLSGERIRLRGWMFPPSREDGITRFMFVRDNGICCFGRRPKVYDKVAVSLKDGTATKYIQGRPFDVIGVLSVEADVEDGEVMWLYALSDATVIDE